MLMAANWCTVCLLVLPWFLDSSVFICMTMCTQWRKTIHRKIKLRRIRIHSPLHSTKLLNNFLLWIEKANYFERWTEKKQAAHFYIENKEKTFSFTWFSRHRPNKYNPINQKKGRSIHFIQLEERKTRMKPANYVEHEHLASAPLSKTKFFSCFVLLCASASLSVWLRHTKNVSAAPENTKNIKSNLY